jgi:hypothetical protein
MQSTHSAEINDCWRVQNHRRSNARRTYGRRRIAIARTLTYEDGPELITTPVTVDAIVIKFPGINWPAQLCADPSLGTSVPDQVITSLRAKGCRPCISVENALRNAEVKSITCGDIELRVYELPQTYQLLTSFATTGEQDHLTEAMDCECRLQDLSLVNHGPPTVGLVSRSHSIRLIPVMIPMVSSLLRLRPTRSTL